MNLKNNNYQLYRKDKAKQIYVNYSSNHPYMIKNEIPNMIQKRLSSLSKDIFEKAKNPYQNALKVVATTPNLNLIETAT